MSESIDLMREYERTCLPAALMVDIQFPKKMGLEDARNYFTHMGTILDDLRKRAIPVTWLTMSTRDEAFPLTSGRAEPRGLDDWLTMDFLRPEDLEESEEKLTLYTDFLEKYGPKTNETVIAKSTFDGFNTSGLLETHLKSGGRQNILMFGGMTSFCLGKTAEGASKCGLKPLVCSDGVFSWQGVEHSPWFDYETVGHVWRAGFADSTHANLYHAGKVRSRTSAASIDTYAGHIDRIDQNAHHALAVIASAAPAEMRTLSA